MAGRISIPTMSDGMAVYLAAFCAVSDPGFLLSHVLQIHSLTVSVFDICTIALPSQRAFGFLGSDCIELPGR